MAGERHHRRSPGLRARGARRDDRSSDARIGRVATRLALADHRLTATIDLADLFTTGTATLGLASPGALDGRDADEGCGSCAVASRLRVATGAPVTGAVSFAAHIEGDRQDLAHVRATVDLQRLDGAVGDVPVRSTQPGRASYDGRTVDVADLALNIGRSELRAMGRLGADPPGTLDRIARRGSARSRAARRRLLPGRELRLPRAGRRPGPPRHARARGSLDRPALNAVASLDEGRVAMADQPQASLAGRACVV